MENEINMLVSSFENLLSRVECGLEIRDALSNSDGPKTFSQIYDDVIEMKNHVRVMKLSVKKAKQDLESMKENCKKLQLVEEEADEMMIFALKNSVAQSVHSPTENDHKSAGNKENVKPAPRLKHAIPQLNKLTSEEFGSVPKYIRSHLTIEQVASGIGEINHILHEKYTLLNKPRKGLSLKENKHRAVYLEQAKEVKGTCHSTFFTDDDVQRYARTLKLKRKTKDSIFLILRHLGKMKEIHKAKITRYCILMP
uniref:SKA complex subunit 1 n=1 Tax=Ciona savignyi TaxID=51511 RepID=H2Z9C6_CIOSA